MNQKYEAPKFIKNKETRARYEKWLSRRASSHAKRDGVATQMYKGRIHKAVERSNGVDAYTGERLDWDLISKYDNEEARKGGVGHWRRFKLLPSVDHVQKISRPGQFRICGLRTNDAKGYMSIAELRAFCKKVLRYKKK